MAPNCAPQIDREQTPLSRPPDDAGRPLRRDGGHCADAGQWALPAARSGRIAIRPKADDCLASAIRAFPAETRDGRRKTRPISAPLASRNSAITRETTDPALVPPYQRER